MLAPRKRFIDVNSKYLGILILIGSLPKHTFGSKESLTNLWREPMSTYSVFVTLRLRLFACNHNQILSKSSVSPNSISSIIFPLTVKLVSSANIRAVVCLRQYDKSSIYTKKKSGLKVEPWGLHKILFLDQIVYLSSTLYSKCFLGSTLVGPFNLCFHFSFSVPLSDQNCEFLP